MIDQTASQNQANLRSSRAWLSLCTIIAASGLTACDSRKKLPEGHIPSNVSILFIRPDERSGQAIVGGAKRGLGNLSGQIEEVSISAHPWSGLRAELARRKPDAVCLWLDDVPEHIEIVRSIATDLKTVVTVSDRAPQPSIGFASIVLDPGEAGARLAEKLPEASDKTTYAVIHDSDDPASEVAYNALRAHLDGKQMNRLTELDIAGGTSAAKTAQQIMEQYKHTGVVVLMRSRDALPSSLQAIGPKILLAVFGVQPEIWPAIQNGQIRAAVGFLDGEIGKRATELMILGLSGSDRPQDSVRLAPHVVTQQSLEEFKKVFAAASGLPPDSKPASP